MLKTKAGAAAKGAVGGVMSAAKTALFSPVTGIVVLVGIVAYELWKGNKDTQEFQPAAEK